VDGVTSPSTAVLMSNLGGVGTLHLEGLWCRHEDPSADLARLPELPEAEALELLRTLHAAPVQPELIGERVREIRDQGATVCVALSPANTETLLPHVTKAEPDLLVIAGTVTSAEHVSKSVEHSLDLKQLVRRLEVPVIVGGCASYESALHLMRTGAAGVIVGYGSTAGVTTSDEVLGISVPMATAIADAAAARREYLDETGGRYVHVLADGDIHTSGDLAKAIACGADAVVLGTPLAVAAESLGGGWYWPSAAAHPSLPRGGLLEVALGQRPSLDQVLNGPSDDQFGSLNLVGGLRRSMAKAGYCDLKEFQKVGLTVGS
jgi:IMP dehydrogenase